MTEPTDDQLPDEQQLDEYLKGDSSVSRQYRQLHGAEVPADLDRLVLRQAEDAVKSRTGQVRAGQGRPAWVRWTAPLAVAASAVLVLSIVVETGMRDETAVLHAPQPTMQAEQRERGESESKVVETIIPEQPARAPGFVPPAEVAAESSIDEQFAGDAPSQQMAPAAPPPPKLETPSPRAKRSAEPMNEAPQTMRPTQPTNEARQTMRPTQPTNEEAQAVAENVSEAPQAVAQDRSSPPPAAAPAAAPTIMTTRSVSRAADDAARALQASSIEEARKQAAGVANEAAREEAREEERSGADRAYSRQISAPMPAPPQAYTDPDAWLKDIRELRKENKQEQADREWRRFRAAFPKYEVAETDIAREAKK